jgi:hypothetical protein
VKIEMGLFFDLAQTLAFSKMIQASLVKNFKDCWCTLSSRSPHVELNFGFISDIDTLASVPQPSPPLVRSLYVRSNLSHFDDTYLVL